MVGEKRKETGVSRVAKRVKMQMPFPFRNWYIFFSASRFRLFFLCGLIMLVTVALFTYPSLQSEDLPSISSFVWPKRTMPAAPLFPNTNSTLVMYSSMDPNEAIEREKAKQLLERSVDDGQRLKHYWHQGRIEKYSHFDHYDHIDDRRISLRRPRERIPPDLTNPRYAPYWPQFRQLLESWVHKKHYDPQVMKELLTAVKNPIDQHNNSGDVDSQLGKPYRTCAVIGNSGILLNKTYGEFIDSHDMVMRLNNARTSGYEPAVGRKTTLSFINSNVLHLCSRRYRCTCHSYGESVPTISYICQVSHLMDVLYCSAMQKAPLLVTDPRFDILCSRIVKYYSLKHFFETTGRSLEDWSSAHEGNLFHYSSGMQAIVLALGICQKVDIFGFGKSLFSKHHYHTNQKSELRLHDYEAEYIFYDDLASNRSSSIPFLNEAGIVIPPVKIYF
ncbi:hypothetical protein O6H91_09G112500 [Diphasiastrum complanatum]|uniref:Uncharacterized protein n=1 Tax=Diphasiastrum complanatum TaxID=34168 RepID=A0ACC2CTA8_DIPCM|nr:hypothetical protein O6H91_Y044500 [Diphasiastrum complanatum]KAJ7545253.1 hypothetical protein O6H91_09G112500 [Diphasiastrum complanatum]